MTIDKGYCLMILRGIPEHFFIFTSSVIASTCLVGLKKIVTPHALAHTIAEEYNYQMSRQKAPASGGKQKEKEPGNEALAASSADMSQKSSNSSLKHVCWKCSKPGHLKKNCQSKENESSSGQGSNKANGAGWIQLGLGDWRCIRHGDEHDSSDSGSLWSDSNSLSDVAGGGLDNGNDLSSFLGVDPQVIPDLPAGFEEDWSNIQLFCSSDSESDRVISLH
ncbi:hypothetical protein EV360DRAFT_74289 [Lentinula raphanica]|nr:hypothetical protein EV360DRAFT_74289 [Lentinula raphanica]